MDWSCSILSGGSRPVANEMIDWRSRSAALAVPMANPLASPRASPIASPPQLDVLDELLKAHVLLFIRHG
jgi:hypothetical protein